MKTIETDWIPHNDAMLSNVKYYNGKDEVFVVLWKDLASKSKDNNIEIIREPEVPIYLVKPNFRVGGNKYMMPLNMLDQVMVRPSQITRRIANEIGPQGVKAYQSAIASRDWRALKQFYKWPYSYGADYPPDMFYRIWWRENCETDLAPYVKTAFSDIETDIIESIHGDMDTMIEYAQCPINAISIYYKHENEMHVYLLIPDGKMCPVELGKLQMAAYVDLKENWDGFIREVHDTFDPYFGKIDYHFHWYKRQDELKMLVDYFFLINQRAPDFVGFWNMSFDMPYMMSRTEILGANSKDVICDPRFPVQDLKFRKDVVAHDFKESSDWLSSSTVPQYLCLMRTYAKHRKQKLYQSYALDAISEIELGQHKIKYGEDDATIRDIAYKNYRKFILYNIKDTLLTKQIDQVTGDLEYTWIVANDNLTAYQHIWSPSLAQRQIVYYEFLQQALGVY